MREPGYVRQSADSKDIYEWFRACRKEAEADGFTWFRFSIRNLSNPTMGLVEGWKEQPDEQGPIRWQLTETGD